LLRSRISPLLFVLNLLFRADDPNILLNVVLLLLKIINLLNQLDILLHKPLVNLLMRLVCLSQRTAQVVNILLQVLAKFLEFLCGVRVILAFSLDFLSHIHLVKPNYRLLKFLVVGDVIQSVVHLVLELSLLLFLLLEDLT
jgi:hypothetical protein